MRIQNNEPFALIIKVGTITIRIINNQTNEINDDVKHQMVRTL